MINHPLAFLDCNRELQQFAVKAQQLEKLQQHYAQIVPTGLLLSSRVFNFDQTLLTLTADNSVTAAKLRHSSQDLMEAFQKIGLNLTEIRIKVQPNVSPLIDEVIPRIISPAARQELSNLADSLQDSPLKTSLQRLALNSKISK